MSCRGTQHFPVCNEATSEMGFPVWPPGRTCNFPFSIFRPWHPVKPRTGTSNFRFSVTSTSVRFLQSEHFHSGTLTRLFQPTFSQNEHEDFFWNPFQSFQVTELFPAREIHSTSQLAMTIRSKCVLYVCMSVCLYVCMSVSACICLYLSASVSICL